MLVRFQTPRLGWAVAILAIVLALVADSMALLMPAGSLPKAFWPLPYEILLPVLVASFAVIGGLIVSRQPTNWIGWICLGIGFVASTNALVVLYSLIAIFDSSAGLRGGLWAAWVVQWLWLPLDGLFFVFLPALFPTGRVLSRGWRWVLWLAVLAYALTIAAAVVYPVMGLWTGGPSCVWSTAIPGPCYQFANPFPLTLPRGLLDWLVRFSGSLTSIAVVLAVTSLFARYRTANVEVRAQLKWLSSVFVLCGCCAAALFVVGVPLHVRTPLLWITLIAALLAIPVSIGFAILKYRLYDIDVVINKTVLFGAMAAFITLVYVAIVVGIGHLVGQGSKPNLGLSILATAVVAVAFQPVRERVQRVANRLVYGKRATPYEVLSQFSERVADVYSSEDVLPRMASVLGEGTGASRADVWIRRGDAIAPAASWPIGDGPPPAAVDVTGQLPTAVPGVSRIVPVQHQGELLGALSINKRSGDALTPVEEKLLADLAAQAGLVLRNVGLTAELQARLTEISRQAVELRASRQRIVATQDAERRRLERNIHDGAQQNLVALTVKLRLAASLAKRDPQRARASVKALEEESEQALRTLRALARGIYPPLLSEQGLVAAVRAEAEKMPMPVIVSTDQLDRYSPDIEAAVYFVCLEALQNVTKHAEASQVQVNLRSGKTGLCFDITDNGTGFDAARDSRGSGLRNMIDRIEAIGGRLAIQSTGQGTTVSGLVPIRDLEPVA
ncbi:MAG: GAF domain-containing sensor histidine kinase [Chloroflexi bacterium]|nr:MAG: GAF domain-containing sensor histidine kinase [Chloroflexota bacterium]